MANGACDDGLPAAGPLHVAMLATPGMGHLIPLAELARRLASGMAPRPRSSPSPPRL